MIISFEGSSQVSKDTYIYIYIHMHVYIYIIYVYKCIYVNIHVYYLMRIHENVRTNLCGLKCNLCLFVFDQPFQFWRRLECDRALRREDSGEIVT